MKDTQACYTNGMLALALKRGMNNKQPEKIIISKQERADRLDKLRQKLGERKIDALLISSSSNISYLVGADLDFNAVAVVSPGQALLLTASRFFDIPKDIPSDWEHRITKRSETAKTLKTLLPKSDTQIAFEASYMSANDYIELQSAFSDSKAKLTPSNGLVERLRAVKSAAEIEIMRKSVATVNEVFAWLSGSVELEGKEEGEVAWMIKERFSKKHGVTSLAFDPIVASGKRGAEPHAFPGHNTISADTLVTLDMGARVDGYCSDCTRTWAICKPNEELQSIHAAVLQAQEEALSLLEPGRTCSEVHSRAQTIIEEAGYGEFFYHGGHSLGIDIHEKPHFTKETKETLEAGNVVTIEPGIYIPGKGGCRIEDEVLLVDGGHEVLTDFPKTIGRD